MDFIANADLLSKVLGAIVALMTAVFAFFRWVRPKLRLLVHDLNSARDSIVGRDAIHDTITGTELVPALPGIGVRMATTETSLTHLASAVAQLVDNDHRLTDLEQRTTALEAAAVERVVTRAESTAAWRAVEAVANSTPEAQDARELDPDQN